MSKVLVHTRNEGGERTTLDAVWIGDGANWFGVERDNRKLSALDPLQTFARGCNGRLQPFATGSKRPIEVPQ